MRTPSSHVYLRPKQARVRHSVSLVKAAFGHHHHGGYVRPNARKRGNGVSHELATQVVQCDEVRVFDQNAIVLEPSPKAQDDV